MTESRDNFLIYCAWTDDVPVGDSTDGADTMRPIFTLFTGLETVVVGIIDDTRSGSPSSPMSTGFCRYHKTTASGLEVGFLPLSLILGATTVPLRDCVLPILDS